MAKAGAIKAILLLVVIALAVWNGFLRDKITIPFLSGLSPLIVWIIAGAVFVLEIIVNFTTSRRY